VHFRGQIIGEFIPDMVIEVVNAYADPADTAASRLFFLCLRKSLSRPSIPPATI